jgi:hypothetical protein
MPYHVAEQRSKNAEIRLGGAVATFRDVCFLQAAQGIPLKAE